ncbi:MAG: YCF48-related protein [Prolixibacteraceae bacterium]|jgi:photosystem II stability/assembly factor-like uncharacterized protein|nr:YCF48-related protein [Prolixibacteraceae bacterium]
MKLFTLLLLICLFPVLTYAQTSNPVIKWKTQEISNDNNLQSMSVYDDNSAAIAGFGRTFKKTTDKGLSWEDIGLLNPRYNFNDMSINGNVGYLVGRRTVAVDNPSGGEDDVPVNGVLLKTVDGGASWSLLNLAAIGEGTDTGLNPNAKGCYALDPYSILTVSDTKAFIFVFWYDISTGTRKSHSAVFKTADGGSKWTVITPDLEGAYISSIKMLGTDIYIGGNKILLKASSENDNVTDLFPVYSAVAGSTAFVNEIRFYNNEIYVQATGATAFSIDGGATFTKITALTGGNDIFKLDNNVIINIGTASKSKATIDGGTTWNDCKYPATGFEISGVFNDTLYTLAAATIYKIAVNDLKTANYKWVAQKIIDGTSVLQKIHFVDTDKILLIGNGQIAKKSTDKGITWTDATLPELFVYGGEYDFRSVSSSGNAGYLSSRRLLLIDYPSGIDYYLSGLVYKTGDAWKTWTLLNNKNVGKDTPADASKYPTMAGCYGMDNYTIECVDAQTAYMYAGWTDTVTVPKTETKHSRVFKTTDGGDSWTAITDDFGSSIVMSIKFSGETGYIAGNKILLKTTDGGKTFTDLYPKIKELATGNPVVSSVAMLTVDEVYFPTSNNQGIFSTKDGGVTFTKLSGATTGLDFVVLDKNSFMAVGVASATKFTNDGGATWKDSSVGSTITIYAAGKVLNDSLYVLAKSNVYKIAVSDLDIKTFAGPEINIENNLKVYYGPSELELVSDSRTIDRCMVYSAAGSLVAITEPGSKTCRFTYNDFSSGVYIIAAFVEGKRYTQKVVIK